MLANILKSRRAVQASIVVVRAFVSLRRTLATHQNLLRKVEAIERRLGKHDVQLREVMQILRRLLEPPPTPPKRAIGFVAPGKKVGVIAK